MKTEVDEAKVGPEKKPVYEDVQRPIDERGDAVFEGEKDERVEGEFVFLYWITSGLVTNRHLSGS